MGARRLAADCLRLLDVPPADVAVTAPRDRAAVVSFRGQPGDAVARRACLDELRARLPAGAPLVLVDHNQPRRWPARLVAFAALALQGQRPARARHPAARELAAAGWSVERLRLACGERVQLVLARAPEAVAFD
jgi:hypothetical protein